MIWLNGTNPHIWYDAVSGYYYATMATTAPSTGNNYIWPSWQTSGTSSNFNNCHLVGGTSSAITTNLTNDIIYCYPAWHDQIAAPAIIHNTAMLREQQYRQLLAEQTPPLTPEQVRARREQAAQRERERKTAHDRANELLLAHLTPEQRETVKQHGWFVVQGGKSKNRYRISTRGVAGNVELLTDADRAVYRFCCHLEHGFPSADHHLAQKLMLEHDENDFLRLANRSAA